MQHCRLLIFQSNQNSNIVPCKTEQRTVSNEISQIKIHLKSNIFYSFCYKDASTTNLNGGLQPVGFIIFCLAELQNKEFHNLYCAIHIKI
jgi:hypothetical protein